MNDAERAEVQTLIARASASQVIAFLREVDPDGAWSPEDRERILRMRATDLAIMGVVDGVFTVRDLPALLGKKARA